MTPRLAVFDCDGVLVDSEGPVNELLAASLTHYGLPTTVEECENQFVGGAMPSVFREARRRGADLPDNWLDEIYSKMFERLSQGVDLIDGAMDVINALEAKGVPVWIASNGPMQKMRLTLGPHGLWERLCGRILSREHFAAKPAPDMIEHAIRQSAVETGQAVMIDDSESGCLAGVRAGVRTLGFAQRGQADALRLVGAEPVKDMREVAVRFGLSI
ncbi:HAD superfamily hydrolase (TIGR01509 family) [Shimia isoporae]|uniref:phosphoglycolate phosphatase n=1 Tax=Shimia isoporae TaxID=647720 RepID=A0A4R1N587_9RHOB|nr:HAD family phosphatase [Shimia isoporae]TCL01240.1 HAD superfamily hydrolase (TIGR01509 family) [Shimia isoporae]